MATCGPTDETAAAGALRLQTCRDVECITDTDTDVTAWMPTTETVLPEGVGWGVVIGAHSPAAARMEACGDLYGRLLISFTRGSWAGLGGVCVRETHDCGS